MGAEKAGQGHFHGKGQKIPKGVLAQGDEDPFMAAGPALAGLVDPVPVNEHQTSACHVIGGPVNEVVALSFHQIIDLIIFVVM